MNKIILGCSLATMLSAITSNTYAEVCPSIQNNSDSSTSVFVGAHVDPTNGGNLSIPGTITCEYGIGPIAFIATFSGSKYLVNNIDSWTFNVNANVYDCYNVDPKNCSFTKQ